MGVSLIPFSTGLLGQFPEDRTALGVYGLNLIMVGGFLYAHWSYAARDNRLVERDIDPAVVRLAEYRIMMGSGCFDLGNLYLLRQPTTESGDLCFDSAPVPDSRAN